MAQEIISQPYWYILLIFSYLLGSIPFAYLIAKIFTQKDIRKLGSKNIGSTNVTRVLGKKYGVLTFLLDFSKTILVLWVVNTITDSNIFLALSGFFVLLGHTKSVFLKFLGGKGVACNFAIWSFLSFYSALAMLVVWVIFYYWKKIVSLASIISCVALPIFVYFFAKNYFFSSFIFSFYILLLHLPNIKRLLKKEEFSFNLVKK